MDFKSFNTITSGNPIPITALTFTPKGRGLIYANRHNEVFRWDIDTNCYWEVIQFGSNGRIKNILLKSNDIWVVGKNIFSLYNTTTEKVLNMLPYTCGDVHALSADGNMVAVTQAQNSFLTLSKEDPALVLQSTKRDSKVLFVIRNEEFCCKAIVLELYEMTFSSDGKKIAALVKKNEDYYGWTNQLYVWNVGKNLSLFWHDTVADNASVLTFSPNNHLLAFYDDEDNSISLISLVENVQSKWLYDIGERVLSLAFSPDGRLLASGGHDQKLRIWDVESDSLVFSCTGGSPITAVSFSPDGHSIAFGDENGKIVFGESMQT